MDALTPVINGALLAVFTVVLTLFAKGQFDALNRRMDQLEARIGRVEAELSELRGMMMQLAIAVGVQARPETG